jgi:agmatine deiminase
MSASSLPRVLPAGHRVPAEWEPQAAVSIATPPGNEVDPSLFAGAELTSVASVHGAMVRALAGHTRVRLLARTRREGLAYAQQIGAGALPADAFEVAAISHCDIWVRDTGPIWALSEHGEPALVWMGFTNWGYFPRITGDWASCDIPNYLPRDLGAALGLPVFRTPLVGEGGDKSFNGQGSLLCCLAVERDRNPQLSVSQLTELLCASFNVRRVIWVSEGLAADAQTFNVHPYYGNATLPGGVFTPIATGGHVDEFCRFVGPRTVLLAEVHRERLQRMTPSEEITHYRMAGNLKLLQEQRDQDGAALEIVRMPLPPDVVYTIDQRDPIWYTMRELRGVQIDGPIQMVLASSYCNFLVSNGVILFPRYYRPGMSELVDQIDHEARAVIERVFPGHTVKPIDPSPVNAGGGGMHCITNDQPRH